MKCDKCNIKIKFCETSAIKNDKLYVYHNYKCKGEQKND